MKKLIRLTESDLHRIVKESVKRILRENTNEMIGSGLNPEDLDYEENEFYERTKDRNNFLRNFQHNATEKAYANNPFSNDDRNYASLWAHDHPEAPDATRERWMDVFTDYDLKHPDNPLIR